MINEDEDVRYRVTHHGLCGECNETLDLVIDCWPDPTDRGVLLGDLVRTTCPHCHSGMTLSLVGISLVGYVTVPEHRGQR